MRSTVFCLRLVKWLVSIVESFDFGDFLSPVNTLRKFIHFLVRLVFCRTINIFFFIVKYLNKFTYSAHEVYQSIDLDEIYRMTYPLYNQSPRLTINFSSKLQKIKKNIECYYSGYNLRTEQIQELRTKISWSGHQITYKNI